MLCNHSVAKLAAHLAIPRDAKGENTVQNTDIEMLFLQIFTPQYPETKLNIDSLGQTVMEHSGQGPQHIRCLRPEYPFPFY
jgi:hypothetical protein